MNSKHLIAFSALFAATQAEALPVASVSLDTVTVSPSAPYTDTNGLLTDYGNAAASPWMKNSNPSHKAAARPSVSCKSATRIP